MKRRDDTNKHGPAATDTQRQSRDHLYIYISGFFVRPKTRRHIARPKLCMYVGYHDANNVSNFGSDPVTQLKNVFVYEIGLIAIREVSPPFDEEQQYRRPHQPKRSPS